MKGKKAISLISPGFDSAIASYLMKKRGMEITYLHMKTKDTDDSLIKKIVEKIDPGAELIIIDYREHLNNVKSNAKSRYICLLCKRGMYRIAEKIARERGIDCILTGESLGQVASQTLENMKTISSSITMPVIRPLLCYDKDEIIKIAREIGTNELSEQDKGRCPFVPDNPATSSTIEKIKEEEDRINI